MCVIAELGLDVGEVHAPFADFIDQAVAVVVGTVIALRSRSELLGEAAANAVGRTKDSGADREDGVLVDPVDHVRGVAAERGRAKDAARIIQDPNAEREEKMPVAGRNEARLVPRIRQGGEVEGIIRVAGDVEDVRKFGLILIKLSDHHRAGEVGEPRRGVAWIDIVDDIREILVRLIGVETQVADRFDPVGDPRLKLGDQGLGASLLTATKAIPRRPDDEREEDADDHHHDQQFDKREPAVNPYASGMAQVLRQVGMSSRSRSHRVHLFCIAVVDSIGYVALKCTDSHQSSLPL